MTLVVVVAVAVAVAALGVMRSRFNDTARRQRSQGNDSVWFRSVGSRSVSGRRKTVSVAAGVVGLACVLAGAAAHGTAATALFAVGLVAIVTGYGLRLIRR